MHRGLRSLASPRSTRPALGALSIIATALFAGCPDDGRRNNEGAADALDTVGGPSDTADAGDPGADIASDTPTPNDGADATELPAVLCANGSCDCLAQNIGVGYVRDDGSVLDQGLASKAITLDGSTLDGVVAAVRADGHSCARRAGGTAACWAWLSNERNQNGELGSGVIGGSVQLGEASVALSAAGTPLDGVLRLGGEGSACQVSATLCAIVTGGGLYCWGDNPNGAFFAGSADRPWATPMLADTATALSGVDEVAVGFDHICARRGGEVACWGISFSGQIGTGSLGSEDYPVVVSALPAGVSQIIAGARYSCALAAGDVYCWGAIDLVGNGADDDADPGCGGCVRTPVRVLTATGPLTGVARLVGASRSACAITTAGTVYCWGDRSPAAPAGVAALATPVALPTGTTDHMLCQSGTSASTLNYVNPDGSYHVANAELPVVCEP